MALDLEEDDDFPPVFGGGGGDGSAGIPLDVLRTADVGVEVQAWDAKTTAWAGLTWAANKFGYFTGATTAAVASITAAGRAMLAAADATAQTALLTTATPTVAGILKARVATVSLWNSASVGGATYTNLPATTTEWLGSARFRIAFDGTGFTQCRLYVCENATAPAAGSKASLQYSLDGGTTWFYMDDSADGALVAQTPQVTLATNSCITSAWMTLGANARADLLLRAVTVGGDGVADPTFNSVVAQFR